MALLQESLVTTSTDLRTNPPMIISTEITTAKFATGSGTLAAGYPIGYDSVNELYGAWVAPDPTVYTVVAGTAGTIVLTVNGIATPSIAYNATQATIEGALRSLGYDVTVVSDLSTLTITFDADADLTTLPTVVESTAPTATSSAVTAGTASNGKHNVAGFLWPDAHTLDATYETISTVMHKGTVSDFSEISALVDSGDVAALKAACKNNVLEKGLKVQGILNINQ